MSLAVANPPDYLDVASFPAISVIWSGAQGRHAHSSLPETGHNAVNLMLEVLLPESKEHPSAVRTESQTWFIDL